jgi:predicted amidohydrolase YtcJ
MDTSSPGCPCCANARLFRSAWAGTSRRAALRGLFATAVSATAPALAQPGAPSPITVFTAKKIITMEAGRPEATAVAVRDGRILSVGSLEDLRPWTDRQPHAMDHRFADKILMPGFIEAHGHPLIGGTSLTRPLLTFLPVPSPYGPAFPGVPDKPAALARLAGYAAAARTPDETILAWGYDVVAFGGALLDKTELNSISATQPILVWDASEHLIFANSAALRKFGVTRADLSISGIEAGADGEPNGQFLGTTAVQRILQVALGELLQPEVAMRSMRHLMDLARKNGITTFSELAYGAVDLALEEALFDRFYNDPGHAMRCVVVADVVSMTAAKGGGALAAVQALRARNTDRLIHNGVKFFADDSFLSLGMQVDDPGYTDGRQGIWITLPAAMKAAFTPWWQAGLHINVHSNGNAANQAVIDALAELQAEYPRTDHRFTLQHYGLSTPEQARRLRLLGGVVSVNPYYLHYRSELNAPYLGAERAFTAARLRTLVDAGVPVSLHSDTPVAPPVPLEWVWIAVNRFALSGQVRGAEERVSLDQALRMITIDAAFTLGVEQRVGSIAPGKMADFAVLEADPYTVPKEAIRGIAVWGTIVGGEVFPAAEIRPR